MYEHTKLNYHHQNYEGITVSGENFGFLTMRMFTVFTGAGTVSTFLADDAVFIIPIVLAQQGCPIDDNDASLKQIRERLKVPNQTVTASFFEHLLEQFDVDKRLIHVVNGNNFENRITDLMEYGNTPIYFFNQEKEDVMFPSCVVLQIFENLVCGINWKIDYCTRHSNCLMMCRNTILGFMKKYFSKEKEFTLVLKDQVDKDLELLKSSCSYQIAQNGPRVDFNFSHLPLSHEIKISELQATCERFNLPAFSKSFINGRQSMTVEHARLKLKIGWSINFFGMKELMLLDCIGSALKFTASEDAHKALWIPDEFDDQLLTKYEFDPVTADEYYNKKKEANVTLSEEEIEYNKQISSRFAKMKAAGALRAQQLKDKKKGKPKSGTGVSLKPKPKKEIPQKSISYADYGEKKYEQFEKRAMRMYPASRRYYVEPRDEVSEWNSSINSGIGKNKKKKAKMVEPICDPESIENSQEYKKMEEKLRVAEEKAKKEAARATELEKTVRKLEKKFKNANEYRQKEKEEKELALRNANKNEKKAKKADRLLEKEMKEMDQKIEEMEKELQTLREVKENADKEAEKQLRETKEELLQQNDVLQYENLILKQRIDFYQYSIALRQADNERLKSEMNQKWETLKMVIDGLQSSTEHFLEESEPMNLNDTDSEPSSSSESESEPGTTKELLVPPITGVPDTDCVICIGFRHEDEESIPCENCPRIYHAECLRDWYSRPEAGSKCPSCREILRDPVAYPPLGS